MKKFKQFISDVKEISDDERSIVAYGNKPVKDRDSEVIKSDAWDLKAFKKNPVLMLSHNYNNPPIGKVLWVKPEAEGLKFKAVFAKTAIGQEVYQLYKDGFMKAFSVGFIAKDWEDKFGKDEDGYARRELRTFTDCELLEISCVSVPCCSEALVEEVKSGKSQIKTKLLNDAIFDIKGIKQECLKCDKEFDEHENDDTDLCPECYEIELEEKSKSGDKEIPKCPDCKNDECTCGDDCKDDRVEPRKCKVCGGDIDKGDTCNAHTDNSDLDIKVDFSDLKITIDNLVKDYEERLKKEDIKKTLEERILSLENEIKELKNSEKKEDLNDMKLPDTTIKDCMAQLGKTLEILEGLTETKKVEEDIVFDEDVKSVSNEDIDINIDDLRETINETISGFKKENSVINKVDTGIRKITGKII